MKFATFAFVVLAALPSTIAIPASAPDEASTGLLADQDVDAATCQMSTEQAERCGNDRWCCLCCTGQYVTRVCRSYCLTGRCLPGSPGSRSCSAEPMPFSIDDTVESNEDVEKREGEGEASGLTDAKMEIGIEARTLDMVPREDEDIAKEEDACADDAWCRRCCYISEMQQPGGRICRHYCEAGKCPFGSPGSKTCGTPSPPIPESENTIALLPVKRDSPQPPDFSNTLAHPIKECPLPFRYHIDPQYAHANWTVNCCLSFQGCYSFTCFESCVDGEHSFNMLWEGWCHVGHLWSGCKCRYIGCFWPWGEAEGDGEGKRATLPGGEQEHVDGVGVGVGVEQGGMKDAVGLEVGAGAEKRQQDERCIEAYNNYVMCYRVWCGGDAECKKECGARWCGSAEGCSLPFCL